MVTEAGASVTICLNPEAPYTVSTWMFINSSRLLSNKLGDALLFCARAQVELTRNRSESMTMLNNCLTGGCMSAHDKPVQKRFDLPAAFAGGIRPSITASLRHSRKGNLIRPRFNISPDSGTVLPESRSNMQPQKGW